MKRNLIAFLVSTALSLLMIEGLLRLTDPFAYQVRYDSLSMFHDHVREHPYGYAVDPGEYNYLHWDVTIRDDHTRRVPDTRASDCQIVMLGDSVMFGYGVSDDETLPNHLARRFPDVEFINAALTGYNSPNVRRVYEAYRESAEGFVYLIVDNDASGTFALSEVNLEPQMAFTSWYGIEMKGRWQRGLVRYPGVEVTPAQVSQFVADTAPLFDDPRVLMASYGDVPFTDALEVDVRLTLPDETIAPGDMHPSGRGNATLARGLAEGVGRLVGAVCEARGL